MIVRSVARVELFCGDGPDNPPMAGENWRVEWTTVRKGKALLLRQTHCSEAAARRHVAGLLEHRAAGLTVDGVYREWAWGTDT